MLEKSLARKDNNANHLPINPLLATLLCHLLLKDMVICDLINLSNDNMEERNVHVVIISVP